MFERMEIAESIYEGVVEISYKKPTGESALQWNFYEKGESAGKRRKRHVDIPTGKSKTCLIHGPGNSSEECKVLGDFVTKYANSRPTKEYGKIPLPRKKVNKQQENNAIVKNEVDEILLTKKVNATNHEAPEFLDSDYDENDLYQVDKMSLKETREKLD